MQSLDALVPSQVVFVGLHSLRGNPPTVTTHVSAWFGRDQRSSNLGRQPDLSARRIARTCEVGGYARPNHGLTTVVTAVAFAEASLFFRGAVETNPTNEA